MAGWTASSTGQVAGGPPQRALPDPDEAPCRCHADLGPRSTQSHGGRPCTTLPPPPAPVPAAAEAVPQAPGRADSRDPTSAGCLRRSRGVPP